jgi:RNA polymerase sigma-70 factor (ECF subfamily)
VKTKPALPASDYRKLSDEELVYRFAHRQEQAAMTALFERYGHLIYGVCLKLLKDTEAAKDAMQQVFIQLIDDLPRFQITHFKSWLYRVARNHCLMQLRKSRPVNGNVIIDETADEWDVEDENGLHHKVAEEARYQRLETALTELNNEQRTCIDLFYLQRLTYADISEKTGWSVMAVKSHIQNGRRNLKIKITTDTASDAALLP